MRYALSDVTVNFNLFRCEIQGNNTYLILQTQYLSRRELRTNSEGAILDLKFSGFDDKGHVVISIVCPEFALV